MTGLSLGPGLTHFPGCLDRAAQERLVADIDDVLAEAPLFRPRMPRTGKPFSVVMSNCGTLGWVSDEAGYRYQPTHPETGRPWPSMLPTLSSLWERVTNYPLPPEACLINFYRPDARMSLHQDRDEDALDAPVLSVSLGDTALFRIGGLARRDPTRSLRLASGDVFLFGGPARLVFHGIDRIFPGTSTLRPLPGRINLTLRRVTVAAAFGSRSHVSAPISPSLP